MTDKEQEEFEDEVIADMMAAREIAAHLFGAATLKDEHRVFDYMEEASDDDEFEKGMMKARAVTEEVFKSAANNFGCFEIFEYLNTAKSEKAEREFAADLKKTVENAKKIYGESPTPEQVFGLFERLYKAE